MRSYFNFTSQVYLRLSSCATFFAVSKEGFRDAYSAALMLIIRGTTPRCKLVEQMFLFKRRPLSTAISSVLLHVSTDTLVGRESNVRQSTLVRALKFWRK